MHETENNFMSNLHETKNNFISNSHETKDNFADNDVKENSENLFELRIFFFVEIVISLISLAYTTP